MSQAESMPLLDRSSEGGFVTTRWSLVLAAGGAATPNAAGALDDLCRAYWYPLYAYVRRRGLSPEDAQDLTQGFFASFLEKGYLVRANPARGRFRTFLLKSMENFLHDSWDRASAQKRGGGHVPSSLDVHEAEGRYAMERIDDATPERLFEKRWATTLLERVLHELRTDFARLGKPELFEQLKPHLWGEDEAVPYPQLSAGLNMSVSALKVAAHRLRQRFRELLRQEIAQTVADEGEVDDEIRHLIAVLGA